MISYEDEEGDKVEVDDDDTLQMFFETQLADGKKKLKLLCSKEKKPVDDLLTEQVTMAQARTNEEKEEKKEKDASTKPKEVRTFEGHAGAVYSCCFNPTGEKILSASRDKTLRIWNAADGSVKQTFKGHTGFVLSCDYSPNDNHIVSSDAETFCKIWDVRSGKRIVNLKGHTDKVYSVKYSPQGMHIASASCDYTCKVWNAETGGKVSTLKGHELAVFSCGFSEDSRHIVSAADDHTVKVYFCFRLRCVIVSTPLFSPRRDTCVELSRVALPLFHIRLFYTSFISLS